MATTTEVISTTMHLLDDIRYWLPGHDHYASPFRLRKYHDSVKVVAGPMPFVPGEGHWGNSGSKLGYVVETPHGHRIAANANLLSADPLCHGCGEPRADLDEQRRCSICRDS